MNPCNRPWWLWEKKKRFEEIKPPCTFDFMKEQLPVGSTFTYCGIEMLVILLYL